MRLLESMRNPFSFSSLAFLLLAPVLLIPRQALAIGDAATHFVVYVNPNAENMGRYSMLIVTAVNGGADGTTHVNIVDDAADGDADDTLTNISLIRGQSQVI